LTLSSRFFSPAIPSRKAATVNSRAA
jgi:hypothetical protein